MPYSIKLISPNDSSESVNFSCEKQTRITTASEKAGYSLIYCDSGYCGACQAHLIKGSVQSVDGLNKISADGITKHRIFLCQNIAKSDLLIKPLAQWFSP